MRNNGEILQSLIVNAQNNNYACMSTNYVSETNYGKKYFSQKALNNDIHFSLHKLFIKSQANGDTEVVSLARVSHISLLLVSCDYYWYNLWNNNNNKKNLDTSESIGFPPG